MRMWAAGGFEYGVHFTKGEVVKIGDESFLVAYQLPIKVPARTISQIALEPPPRPQKPDAEKVSNLLLLNLKSIDSLNDLRPFDANTDMDSDRQARADSVKTLEELGQEICV